MDGDMRRSNMVALGRHDNRRMGADTTWPFVSLLCRQRGGSEVILAEEVMFSCIARQRSSDLSLGLKKTRKRNPRNYSSSVC